MGRGDGLSEYEDYIAPPYAIAIRDPEGLDRDRGGHQLVLGRGNLDSVFSLTTDELIELARESLRRLSETDDVDLHSLLGSV